jgi:putative transposase
MVPLYQAALRADLNALFQAKTMQEAVQKRDDILESYGDVAERAMKCLEDGLEDAMTVLLLPIGMRRFFRTSNHIERINRELKRRSGVIGVFPNETSLMRLIGSTLIELNEKRQAGKAVFSAKSYAEMMASNTPSELRRAAIRQQNMAAA